MAPFGAVHEAAPSPRIATLIVYNTPTVTGPIGAAGQLRSGFLELDSAIDLCLSKSLSMPALMLLYTGIDIAGWVEATIEETGIKGREAFVAWVDKYMKPRTTLGCSALDLYAARCGVLHTMAPDSDLYQKWPGKEGCLCMAARHRRDSPTDEPGSRSDALRRCAG